RPMIVAVNKVDRPVAAEGWPDFRGACEEDGLRSVAISAMDGTGLAELRSTLADLLPSAEELAAPPEPAGVVVHRIEAMGDGFKVDRDQDRAFRVSGRRIERL